MAILTTFKYAAVQVRSAKYPNQPPRPDSMLLSVLGVADDGAILIDESEEKVGMVDVEFLL